MPQARRQEAQERARKGLPVEDGEPREPVEPTREYMVMWLMTLGMTREAAEAEYEAQLSLQKQSR